MAKKRSSSTERKTPATKRTTKKRSTRTSASTSTSTSGGTKRAAKKKRATRYGDAASKKVGRALHEAKRGTLRSGRSKKKVTSRKQAVAIGLSEARKSGAKVPPKPQ